MSGLDDRRNEERTAAPPALQRLAESSRAWHPSARVEEALHASWDAARASRVTDDTPIREANGVRRGRAWTAWGAVAASLVAALVWWGTPPRAARDQPVAMVDRDVTDPLGARAEPAQTEPGEAAPRTVAVPSGPFEPPPPPRPAATREGSSRATPRARPAARPPASAVAAHVAQHEGPSGDVEPFVWLPAAEPIEPGLGLQVVRMTLPHARWEGRAPGQDAVQADVLMGDDGLARAVRVVRTSTRR